MNDIGRFFASVIEWGLIPLILLVFWVYGFFVLPGKAEAKKGQKTDKKTDRKKDEQTAQKSARAGRWAGLVLFVLFVLWRSGQGDSFQTTPVSTLGSWFIPLVLTGAVVGFFFSWAVAKLKDTWAFPLLVLVLVGLLSIAPYAYGLILSQRGWMVLPVLGLTLGRGLRRAFWPTIASKKSASKEAESKEAESTEAGSKEAGSKEPESKEAGSEKQGVQEEPAKEEPASGDSAQEKPATP